MVRKPIFDTSVFPDFSQEIEKLLPYCLFPTIIFYELIATSIDDSTLQKYQRWRVLQNKNDSLINPTKTDWWEIGKAIRRLYLLKIAPQTKLKTLRNDALISRLAVRNKSFVVTHDVDDFQIIQKVMTDLRVISAKEFFEG